MEHNRFFRHLNPALRKSNPKAFARYMRGAVKESKYFFTASKSYKSRLGNLQRVLLLGWRAKRPCCQRILGALPILTRALLRRQWFSIICSTGFGLCLLIACLVSLIAAGEGGKPLYWCDRGPGESAVSV